jgi:hypothetical protein
LNVLFEFGNFSDLQEWYDVLSITITLFDKKLLRPELLALAKTNKPEPQYIIDDIATSAVSPRLEPHRTGFEHNLRR